MASLNTLEVRGLSRFLNTIYANDLTVNGTFGTSGNMSVGGTLAVTGNTTISGTLTLSSRTDLSGTANNSPALIVGGTATQTHMEIDNNEIQAKTDGTSVATLNINLDGGLVKMGSGGLEIAGALKATGATTLGTANITTATVSTGNFTNVNVSNVLRATRYDLQTVGQLGGAFYVSPTVKFPNNATTIKVEKNNTTLTITIFDASINADTMAGVAWNIGTKVKASGKLGTVVTGTMDGEVTNINRSSGYMTIVVSGENSGNVVAKDSYAVSEISDFYVMAYSIALNDDAETSYPVGIILNSYGTNNSTYIDLYGGASTTPNVRIGNLGGLFFNDSQLSPQWGLYTTNGYFSGTINANQGKIAGWTISNYALTKISPAIDNVRYSAIIQAPLDEGMASSNVAFGVRTSTNNANWVYPFLVNYAGQLKTTNILATGGNIAGWAISSTSLSKDSSAIDGTIYGAVLSAPTVSPTSIAYAVRNKASSASDWTDYPFVVKYDGSLKATNADISGKITATSGSISGSLVTSGINADNITAGTMSVERLRSLEVGGRNLILKSSQSRTVTLESATGGYYTDYYDESEYGKTITNGNTTDYFVLSYDWSTTSETGAAWAQFNGTSIGQIAYVEGYKTSGTVERNKIDLSEGSGHYMAVFKFTSAQASAASQAPRIRIDGSTLAQTAGSTLTISNVKLERANVATAYSPAPEDTYTEIQGTNLSPFFSHMLTDVYDATTNPNGYWVKNGANGWTSNNKFTFTQLEDGWLHVHIDNSSGTAVIRNDCCCPRYNPIIKPNIKYTFLIEFRNNTSTNIGTNSNIYLVQQGGGVQFWGTNVPTGSAAKLEGVGDSNVINLSAVPTDGSYVFNRSTKLSLDTTDTYYGTNMMMTYVFRADAGAVLDYDIRISMYEGEYWGPYAPYVISDISSIRQNAETALSQSIEYIIGTQTAATGSWTGVSSTLSELKDGTQIRYWLPYAGSGNATLNLTLKDGSKTGAINIYRQGGSASSSGVVSAPRVTTHFPAGSSISMTYGVNRVVSAVYSGTTYTGTFTGWFVDGAYDSGNTYNRVRMQNVIKAATAITASRIICGTSAGYKNIAANISFDLSYPLLYASSAINANATGDNNYLQINGINASNNGTITSGGANKMLYLKGTVSGNTFTISASPFMTTVVPSSQDNFIYIPLGIMYSATNIYFISSDKLYAYKDGSFKELSRGEASLAAKTATNYLYYDSTNGLIISENASGQTYNSVSSGYNTQLKSDGLYIRNNSTVLAKYGTEATIGQDNKAHVTIGSSRMYFSDGDDSIFFAGDAANGATTRPVVLIMNTKSQDTAGGAGNEFWIEHPDGYWSEYGEIPIESITTVEAVSEDDSVISMVLPSSQYNIEYTTRNGKNYLKKVTVIDPNYDINSNDDYTPFWYTYPIIRITAVTSAPNIIYHMQEESESSVGNNKEAGYGVAESNSKALGLRSHAASGGTAIAPGSWAIGPGTVSEFPNSLVIGKYNKRGTRNIFTIGNGIDDTTGRSDAFSVSPEGVVTLKELQFNSTPAEIRREGNISDNIMVNDEYIDETDSDLAINVYKIGALVQVNLAFRNAYGQNIPQDTPIMYGFPRPLMPRTVRIGSNIERSNAVVLMINDDGELVSWWGQYIQTGNMIRIGFMYLAAEEW